MQLRQIHHVGYVVEDIDAALPVYERFGMTVQVRETLPEQGVEAVLLGGGPSHVELIRPVDEHGSIQRFLERRGPGMHHVAFAVPDIRAALAELAAAGVQLIDAEPRVGLGGHLVAFIHPRSAGGVLTELVEDHGS